MSSGIVALHPDRTGTRLWLFGLWLLLFYSTWLTVVWWQGQWTTVQEHWPIALAMALGSYVAGSTPMGGGTVGFPVLVLLFEMPGSLGRNFGLAVQSIGMVSASIYILCVGRPVDWGLLRPAMLGAVLGMPVGAAGVALFVPDIWVKLLFAIVWCSFGIMHLLKLRELVAATGISDRWRAWDRTIGLAVGFSGGIVASITGVGIDMMIYATLVLLYRADLKLAIPTSVILMAFTSLVGISCNLCLARAFPATYPMDPAVYANWLAAAPVVAVGAPFGAWVVNFISRTPTLLVVSILCIGQFIWTLTQEAGNLWAVIAAVIGVMAVNAVFHILYRLGRAEPLVGPLHTPPKPTNIVD